MGMPTFSRFCFCLNLQMGNKIFCWIFLIIYIAIFLIALFALIFGIDIIQIDEVRFADRLQNETLVQEEVQEVHKARIGVADSVGTLIISAILAVVCYFFIHGINFHDTGKMMPYIIQNGVFGVLFIGAAIYYISFIFLIKSIIFIYISIAAYSLYEVFAYEETQKQENVQMNENLKEYGHNYEAESYSGFQADVTGGYDEKMKELHGP